MASKNTVGVGLHRYQNMGGSYGSLGLGFWVFGPLNQVS